MAETKSGEKTALEIALAAWEEVDAERERRVENQLDLFAAPAGELSVVVAEEPPLSPGPRGPGRPPGSRNRATQERVDWWVAKNGGRHPLERGIEIAGLPILQPGVLEALAARFGCTRFEAAKWWGERLSAVLPYVAPRLGSIEIKPPGAPGSGQPVLWSITEQGLALLEHDEAKAEDGDEASAADGDKAG